jgi:hypothetical protein
MKVDGLFTTFGLIGRNRAAFQPPDYFLEGPIEL